MLVSTQAALFEPAPAQLRRMRMYFAAGAATMTWRCMMTLPSLPITVSGAGITGNQHHRSFGIKDGIQVSRVSNHKTARIAVKMHDQGIVGRQAYHGMRFFTLR
jgi:hypothetical protein